MTQFADNNGLDPNRLSLLFPELDPSETETTISQCYEIMDKYRKPRSVCDVYTIDDMFNIKRVVESLSKIGELLIDDNNTIQSLIEQV